MNKIKVVYDWMGPLGPIPNNESPTILQLASTVPGVRTGQNNSLKFMLSTFYMKAIQNTPELFELVPSFFVNPDDVFLYPFDLHHRYPIQSYFNANHSPGIIEMSSLTGGSNIINYIKKNNGYILLEYSFECYLEPNLFLGMHNYFKIHSIPLDKVIYLTGSPDAAKVYKKFCDEQNISSRMNVVFWDVNEYNYSRMLKTDPNLEKNHNFEDVKKTFICLNRRFREHRNNLFAMFYRNNLLEHSYFSMPSHDADGSGFLWKTRCDESFLGEIGLSNEINNMQSLLPLKVDDVPYHTMVMDSKMELKQYYKQSLISVVTETTFNEYVLQISEKSYKPIAYKIPFIFVNSPGALKYFKKAGYKTFSDFFDEGYDEIENGRERVKRIGQLCYEINNWTYEQKREFFEKTRPIVKHNYDFLLETFPKKLKGEFWEFLMWRNNI